MERIDLHGIIVIISEDFDGYYLKIPEGLSKQEYKKWRRKYADELHRQIKELKEKKQGK